MLFGTEINAPAESVIEAAADTAHSELSPLSPSRRGLFAELAEAIQRHTGGLVADEHLEQHEKQHDFEKHNLRPGLFGELTARDVSKQTGSDECWVSRSGGAVATPHPPSDKAAYAVTTPHPAPEKAAYTVAAPQPPPNKAAYGDAAEKIAETEQSDGRSKVFWCVIVGSVLVLALAAVVALVLLLVVLPAASDDSSSSGHNSSSNSSSNSPSGVYCSQHYCNTTAFTYQYPDIPLNTFSTTRMTTAFTWSVANVTFSNNQNVGAASSLSLSPSLSL